jgi:type VI secretion system VasD/TssJ family lipoprotein
MKVEVVFTASDSLNFDGNQFQAVQVKAYILKHAERFHAADVRAFFDPGFDPGYMSEFGKDTLGSVTAIVAPGEETRPLTIEIPFIRVREEKPVFAVVGNFAQPPRGENRERMVFDIKKKTRQTVRIELGTNWVARK